jgi:class 3 adenylate cyclase
MRIRAAWSFETRAGPEALWPHVSDTQRFNRVIGTPVAQFTPPAPQRGFVRAAAWSYLGQRITWDELPYEWTAPDGWAVERRYHTGPLRRLTSTLRLERAGPGTRLAYVLAAETRHWWWAPLVFVQLHLVLGHRIRQALRQVISHAEGSAPLAFIEPKPTLAPAARPRLEVLARELERTHPPALVARLVSLVRDGGDRSLLRIRPFSLAKSWGEDRLAVLRLCLQAARAGLLVLSWDVVCPHCRGPTSRTEQLDKVRSAAHCASCVVDFEADFSRAIELTFRPSPLLRAVESGDYCVGGPGNTPHIVAQRRVAPGATDRLELALPAGGHRLRGMGIAGVAHVSVRPGGAAEVTLSTDAEGVCEFEVDPHCTLVLRNANADREAVFVVERADWLEDAATAAEVTALQGFRDLFSREALSPGERLEVGRLAFLFTDLKDSTALYSRVGDASAFAAVRAHFAVLLEAVARNRGAVVKTIGDAVMAVFMDPADAVRTAAEALEGIAALRTSGSDGPLTVKLGVHAGPCLAVTLNERLDYFGTTVNLAARVQGEAVGGDLVLTRAMLEDPPVAELVRSSGASAESFTAALKGISGPVELVRLRFPPMAPPREKAA